MSAKPFSIAAVLLSCVLCGGTRADTPVADEYEIKAAMLAPFVIGISGSDDMELALGKTIARAPGGKTASGRPILIKKISGVEGIDQCRAVFVGGSDRKRLQAVLQAVGTQPVLTIGESDKFTNLGGIVALLVKDDRVQVEVNLPAAQSAGLSISSRLLRIATVRSAAAL